MKFNIINFFFNFNISSANLGFLCKEHFVKNSVDAYAHINFSFMLENNYKIYILFVFIYFCLSV